MSDESRLDPCPLCGCRVGRARTSVRYAEIWQALEADWGATFSEPVRRRHEPLPQTTLIRCDRCGLEYFSPKAPGDQGFYRELMSCIPYTDERWEFEVVDRRLPPGARVVDLGCGGGAFLRRISGRVARAVGLDHNAGAIAELQAAGIEAYDVEFASFAELEPGAFDIVCAFHTLEHLPDAAILMGPVVACARPGGSVFVSVPNRDRFRGPGLEPLDCPPHHVSRWAADHFRFLADRFGLQLVSVAFEEPDLSHVRLWRREQAGARFPVLGKLDARVPVLDAYARIAVRPFGHARAARAGRYTALGLFGQSMIGEFRVPGGSPR